MNPTFNRRGLIVGAAALAGVAGCRAQLADGNDPIAIATPMRPPRWAQLQRELLRRASEACEIFYAKYFDTRGYFQCVERWGADDGPDDAIENCSNWPQLHALGGADRVLTLYRQAWEGHLQQYTQARTTVAEIARDGMYYREFPGMNDWQHTSEFLSVFNVMGLSGGRDAKFQERVRRYASFYLGDEDAPRNYDRHRRLIRSLINGSRGPLLRKATTMDWAGDPFDPSKFLMEHGERTFDEVLAHFAEYGDVVGDSPLNLQTVSLMLNAFMLDGESKYRDWIETYVGAWIERARRNAGILPSHVDLQGRIGGAAGAWHAGVYGWGFSPVVPQTGEREDRNRVPRSVVAFMNAYLLTGDDRYLQVWRTQNDAINSHARMIDGVAHAPTMYGRMPQGGTGWYSYKPGLYRSNGLEIWYLSMRDSDLQRADANHPWIDYLQGRNSGFPDQALGDALKSLQARMDYVLKEDATTRDTRLADALLDYNPAVVTALIHLMCGGIHVARPPWSRTSPSQGGAPFFARLRYFDPARRRAGIPENVAALVSKLTDTTVTVTLVNLDTASPCEVTIQAGGYAEHEFTRVEFDGKQLPLRGAAVSVALAAGAGDTLTLRMRRHVNTPTLNAPWER